MVMTKAVAICTAVIFTLLPGGAEAQIVGGQMGSAMQRPASVRPAQPRVIVEGEVIDSGGVAIPEARVSLYNHHISPNSRQHVAPKATTVSDASGKFRLETELAFGMVLFADAAGYVSEMQEVADHSKFSELRSANVTSATLSKRLVLKKSASVKGIVADAQGQPLSGVSVRALPTHISGHSFHEPLGSSISDGDGVFELTDVPQSDLLLSFTAPGYAPAWTEVSPGEEVAVNMETGATVSGKAFFKENGEAAAGVELSFTHGVYRSYEPGESRPTPRDWSTVAKVGESGAFSVRNVPPGEISVSIPARTNNTQEVAIWHAEGKQNLTVSVGEDQSDVSLEVPVYRGHQITGTVVESGTSNTVAGARVWLLHGFPHRSVVTDSNGVYTFDRIFPNHGSQEFRITAEHPDFDMPTAEHSSLSTRTLDLKLSPDSPVTVFNIPLVRQQKVNGIVLDGRTSAPIAGVKIHLVDGHYNPSNQRGNQAVTSEADGTFTIPLLPTMAVRLRAEAAGYATHVSEVIRPVLNEEVTITLERGATLSGVVVDDSGTSVAGAGVHGSFSLSGTSNTYGNSGYYQEELQLQVTTDELGQFLVEGVPVDCEVKIHARKDGFAPARPLTYALEPGEKQSSVVLQLRKAKHLAGRTLDPAGAPLGGVSINATPVNDFGGGFARSFDDGRYEFKNLPDAPVDITISHAKHGQEWFFDVEVGGDAVDFQFGKGEKDQMSRYRRDLERSRAKEGVKLLGKVVDYRSGQAVTNFKVAAPMGMKVELDADIPGGFTVEGLYRNMPFQNLRISAPGYALYNSGNLFIEEGVNEISRTFKLGPGGSIKGRAIDNSTEAPLAGVIVALPDQQMHPYESAGELFEKIEPVITDAEGNFHLQGIGHGLKSIRFTPPPELGYVEMSQSVDVVYNEVSDIGDVKFGSGGTIKGLLVRTPGDLPIPNSTVQIQHGKSTTTGADGTFEFTGLKNGIYMVEAPAFGTNSWIGIEQLETKELKLEVGTGKIVGSVTRAGQPIACSVFAQKIGYGQSVSRSTRGDASGSFVVENVPPGRWRVTVSATASGSPVSVTEFIIMPESGESVDHAFVLPSGGINVTVLDSGGKPAGQVSVAVRRQAGPDAVLQSDSNTKITAANGIAVFEGLEPGSYKATATTADGLRGEAMGIAVSNDQMAPATINLESEPGGTLISTALNLETGRPVPTAWCYVFDDKGAMFEHGKQRDEMGVIHIENLPPGSYRVQVSAFGFSASEQRVTIAAGQTSRIDDVLYPAGALRWALRDANGSSVTNAPCTLTPNSPDSVEAVRTGVSNQDGTFIVRGLMPGSYTATVTPAGRKPTSAVIAIHAGNATDHVTLVE